VPDKIHGVIRAEDPYGKLKLAAIEATVAWVDARAGDVRLGRVNAKTLLEMDDKMGRLMKAVEDTNAKTK
jgi:hypothetical protein